MRVDLSLDRNQLNPGDPICAEEAVTATDLRCGAARRENIARRPAKRDQRTVTPPCRAGGLQLGVESLAQTPTSKREILGPQVCRAARGAHSADLAPLLQLTNV